MARFPLILATWLAVAAPCAAAPIEAYGRLPAVEAMQISPDGEMIATILTDGEERVISVTRVKDSSLVAGARAGNVKVRDVEWVGPDHVIITSSRTSLATGVTGPRREYFQLVDFNVKTNKLKLLMDDVKDGMNVAFGFEPRIVDGRPLIFARGVYFPSRQGQIALYRIDLDKGGRSERLPADFADSIDFVVDARGEPIAQASYDDRDQRWTLRLRKNGRWQTVKTMTVAMDGPELEGLGRDGQSILISTRTDERRIFQEIKPTGEPGETLPAEDVVGFLWDPVRYSLSGYYSLDNDETRYTYFDPAAAKTWRSIVKAYPAQRVSLVSESDNRRRMIVRVDSPLEGPSYALVDLDAKKADWIGAEYPDLKPADIAEVRSIRYKAADGLELAGYLTLPRGRDAKNLPLVVLPHGGPAVRDNPGFDWWAQALASRGYAVLQVNYRGSDGYGWAFLSAGFGEWGRKMQTDLSDGVRHFAKEGIIDPKRVCIVGASYGGYAALAGAAIDRGVYRCAASVAGPSELRSFIVAYRAQRGVGSQRYWLNFMGADKLSDPALKAISPAALADKVEIPVLLVHGRDDTVVPLKQSQIMADALTKAGKPVELLVMKGEDHWLTRGETRKEMLETVMKFLERNNPPT